MILLTAASRPSGGPARTHEAFVPRSKPTRIRLRSPGRRAAAAESAGRSMKAVGVEAVATGFFSIVVVVVMMRWVSGLGWDRRRQAADVALGRQHGVEQIGNGRRTGQGRSADHDG